MTNSGILETRTMFMKLKRWIWIFSPLILLMAQCKSDDRMSDSKPAALQRHLEDYDQPEGRWGFIDHKGIIRIQAQYDEVRSFREGLAPASVNGLWGFIDVYGKWSIPPEFIKVHNFTNGRARVRGENGLMGLINQQGDTIVPLVYDEIYASKLDLFVVQASNKKGIIDPDGAIILDNIYTKVEIIDMGLFAVSLAEQFDIIGLDGQARLRGINKIKNGGLLRADSGWGAVDEDGNWKLDPIYDNIFYGGETLFIVYQLNKYSIRDSEDIFFTSDKKIKYLGESRFAIRFDNKWSIIDQHGTILLSDPVNSIYSFNEGIAAFKINRQWGYLDLSGQILIRPLFFLPWKCHQDKIRFFTGNNFGFLDRNGDVVIEPRFDDVRDFSEGLAAYQRQ